MEDKTSIWNKTQSEVTVADSMKIGVATAVIMAVAPIIVVGAAAGVRAVCSKLWNRKVELTTESTTEEQ